MAVDASWLKRTRLKNRAQFGMAGMGGLGQTGAQDIAATLERARAARSGRELSIREREAAITAQEALASDPRTAALLALPKIEIPEVQPLPQSVVWIGAAVAIGLLGLVAVSVLRR